MKHKPVALPLTRAQQFKDILWYRKADLVTMSILSFVFCIPMFAWLIFVNYADLFSESNIYNNLIVYGVLVPLIVIAGIGAGGVFYSLRRMVFGEGSNIRQDFFSGIKMNIKAFSLIFFILGLINLALHLDTFILAGFSNQVVALIFSGLSYAFAILLVMFLCFVLMQTLIYQATIKQYFLEAGKLLVAKIIPNIGIFALILWPYFVIDLAPILFTYITLVLLAVFYFAIIDLILILYTFDFFDKTINQHLYPELYKKGLRNENIPNN